MYNTLGLEFLSPTINLALTMESYIYLVKHLKEYCSLPHRFIDREKKIGYYFGPYAYLKADDLPTLDICFTHWREFSKGVEDWEKRSKRINYDKIFLVVEIKYEDEYKYLEDIIKLPYPKVIVTNLPNDIDNSVYHMKFYDKYQGKKAISEFTNIFGKRGIDELNFVDLIFNKDFKTSST